MQSSLYPEAKQAIHGSRLKGAHSEDGPMVQFTKITSKTWKNSATACERGDGSLRVDA